MPHCAYPELCWLQWDSENQHPGCWQCSAAAVLDLSGSAWHQIRKLWLVVPGISVCPVPAWSGAAAARHMVTTRGSPWSRSTKQSLLGPINLLSILVVLWELLDRYLQLFMQEEGTQHHARPQLGHSGHHLTTDGCGDPAQCLLGE